MIYIIENEKLDLEDLKDAFLANDWSYIPHSLHYTSSNDEVELYTKSTPQSPNYQPLVNCFVSLVKVLPNTAKPQTSYLYVYVTYVEGDVIRQPMPTIPEPSSKMLKKTPYQINGDVNYSQIMQDVNESVRRLITMVKPISKKRRPHFNNPNLEQ